MTFALHEVFPGEQVYNDVFNLDLAAHGTDLAVAMQLIEPDGRTVARVLRIDSAALAP